MYTKKEMQGALFKCPPFFLFSFVVGKKILNETIRRRDFFFEEKARNLARKGFLASGRVYCSSIVLVEGIDQVPVPSERSEMRSLVP